MMTGLMMLAAGPITAQEQASLEAEKNRLARMGQTLENRMVEVEEIENELISYDYKLEKAQQAVSAVQLNFEQSTQDLQKAERDHQLQNSSDSERQLRKAQHSFAMAERGVDSRNRRLKIIQSNYQQLQDRLSATQEAATNDRARMVAQERKVERLTNEMLARAEAAKGRKEIDNRSALTQELKIPAPVVVADPAPAPAPEHERTVDGEMLTYVRGEKDRLQKVLEGEGGGDQSFPDLTLKLIGGASIPFEFLGHNQYRLVAPVEAGRQTYKVRKWKFRRTIPADDAGEPYVFIFDARRPSRPRLVMYPEYVLSKLD
ncbi:coiled-coil domain-containing protein [Microbulbifer sp. 2201CG32-9]|uniref:hypothetical protein n=1 Tax=Microbulbifer sp. 2201CG32-9 TaxID=3232309 RepID=UPI00345C106D